MLRIAVIDDDKTLLCDMHKLFDRFIIAYDFDFTVEYFSSCEDIYAKFKAGEKYDLLFRFFCKCWGRRKQRSFGKNQMRTAF